MFQDASAGSVAPARTTDGRGKHLYRGLQRKAPTLLRGRRTPYGQAGESIYRWSLWEYPGLIAGVVQLCHGRAGYHTVRDWIRGKRKPPKWAWHLLAVALDRRIAELTHWREVAKKESAD